MSVCLQHDNVSDASFASCKSEEHALHELSSQERQRAFALRFRTEMCRTYVATGRCDYRDKCMFAHGQQEVRTEAMNEADGLVGDKAIRGWMRERRVAAIARRGQRGGHQRAFTTGGGIAAHRAGARPMIVALPATTTNKVHVAPASLAAKAVVVNVSPVDSDFAPTLSLSPSTTSLSSMEGIRPAAAALALVASAPAAATVVKAYRHNPYSMFNVKIFV